MVLYIIKYRKRQSTQVLTLRTLPFNSLLFLKFFKYYKFFFFDSFTAKSTARAVSAM